MRALYWPVADVTSAKGSQVILTGTSSVTAIHQIIFFRLPQEINTESTVIVYIRLAVIAYFLHLCIWT